MKSCGGRTDLANWAWAVHESIMTLPMHLGYLDWSLRHQMFRTSAISLQQNDLIRYDHTTKDLLTLVKNSDDPAKSKGMNKILIAY